MPFQLERAYQATSLTGASRVLHVEIQGMSNVYDDGAVQCGAPLSIPVRVHHSDGHTNRYYTLTSSSTYYGTCGATGTTGTMPYGTCLR